MTHSTYRFINLFTTFTSRRRRGRCNYSYWLSRFRCRSCGGWPAGLASGAAFLEAGAVKLAPDAFAIWATAFAISPSV